MRILIINSEYPPLGGGAGNASANIAQCLADTGYEVTVLTVHHGTLPRKEQKQNLTILRIPALRRKEDRSTALEQIAFIISASLWTFSLIRKPKPDATLAFFGVPSGAVAFLIKILFRIPYIVSLRGGDVPGFRPYDFSLHHKLIAPFLRLIWKNASSIVANSNGLRDLALKFDSRFEIPIIPNGVDLDLYRTNERDWATPYLLSAGRLVYQKGLDLGMRALADLKHLNWQWTIAGDGPQLDHLKTLAHELGIQDRVIFAGWQSREQIIQQYQQANIFLFPSRHEGMPNAVLEAMASGLPVVASRIAGNEELVVDGKTGSLFPSEDVSSLRDVLQKLLIDSSLYQQMGFASRRRVAEYYSWQNTTRQYVNLLEQVK